MSAMPITFTSIRHGESEGNVAKTLFEQGRPSKNEKNFQKEHTSRWRLTDKGREQAAAAGEWVRRWIAEEGYRERDFRFYCSHYARARETAGHLRISDEWRLDSRIMERNWGTIDEMTYEERGKKFGEEMAKRKDHAMFWVPRGGGESMLDMINRRYLMFMTYRRECSKGHCVQVSHGEVMTVDRYLLEYWTPEVLRSYMFTHDDNVHIHNCRIIQYTRRTAEGTLAEKVQRVRFVNPMAPDDPRTNLDWQPIKRPLFTSAQLLAEVEMFPRVL